MHGLLGCLDISVTTNRYKLISTMTSDGETQTDPPLQPAEGSDIGQLHLPQAVVETLAEARDDILALQHKNEVLFNTTLPVQLTPFLPTEPRTSTTHRKSKSSQD